MRNMDATRFQESKCFEAFALPGSWVAVSEETNASPATHARGTIKDTVVLVAAVVAPV